MTDLDFNVFVDHLEIPYSNDEEFEKAKNAIRNYIKENGIEGKTLNAVESSEVYILALQQVAGVEHLIQREETCLSAGLDMIGAVKCAGAHACQLTYIDSDTSYDEFSDDMGVIVFTSYWKPEIGTQISLKIREQVDTIMTPITKHGFKSEVYAIEIDTLGNDPTPLVKCRCEVMVDWACVDFKKIQTNS